MGAVDVGLQLTLALQLLLASALGALIGLEREYHAHPAGTRTHLLVALGSALFTIVSIHGFVDLGVPGTAPVDPSRVAAQIVTGIGFLGAGAILKYGASIRGLTTAASLWVTAAVGMAVGTGAWIVALVTTAIVVLSLGPLPVLLRRFSPRRRSVLQIRLDVGRLESIGEVSRELGQRNIVILAITTERAAGDRFEVDLTIRGKGHVHPDDLLQAFAELPDVRLIEASTESD